MKYSRPFLTTLRIGAYVPMCIGLNATLTGVRHGTWGMHSGRCAIDAAAVHAQHPEHCLSRVCTTRSGAALQ